MALAMPGLQQTMLQRKPAYRWSRKLQTMSWTNTDRKNFKLPNLIAIYHRRLTKKRIWDQRHLHCRLNRQDHYGFCTSPSKGETGNNAVLKHINQNKDEGISHRLIDEIDGIHFLMALKTTFERFNSQILQLYDELGDDLFPVVIRPLPTLQLENMDSMSVDIRWEMYRPIDKAIIYLWDSQKNTDVESKRFGCLPHPFHLVPASPGKYTRHLTSLLR